MKKGSEELKLIMRQKNLAEIIDTAKLDMTIVPITCPLTVRQTAYPALLREQALGGFTMVEVIEDSPTCQGVTPGEVYVHPTGSTAPYDFSQRSGK